MMCTMNLRRELTYPAPAEQVRAMLTDPAFWDRVAAATGALASAASVTTEGEVTTVAVDQEQAVQGVPSFAKKFVGDSTRAITTARWRGDSAEYQVDAPGKPTSITGTAALTSAGGQTTLVYDLDIRASVPLIGGKLEKLVAELTGAGFDTEHSVGVAWLGGER